MKKYWYTMMLAGSLIAVKGATLISQGAGLENLLKQNGKPELLSEAEPAAIASPLSSSAENDAGNEGDSQFSIPRLPGQSADSDQETVFSESSSSDLETPEEETGAQDRTEVPADDPVSGAATSTSPAETVSETPSAPIDFSSTLFIGDSRTEGLKEYGGLNEAEFFANSGMSTFNLLSASLTLKDGSKKTLEELLSERSYERIYLMLGINELGYPSSTVIRQYSAIVDRIQALQPNARLVLEANLHVTKKKSDSDPTYGNGKLNALNNAIYQIAVDKGCGYVDVNGLFDDGQGNLDSKYSVDNAHIMGKYYTVWAQWLRTQHV